MNKITTENKTHVIIFVDKSKKHITEKEAELIFQKSATGLKGILINGNAIMFSGISKILSLAEYYEQYPDQRPATTNYTKPSKEERVPFTKARHIKALKLMIVGFEKNFEGREMPPQSKKILDNMRYRLKLSEDDPSEVRGNPVEEIMNINF
jgi:hypothetical protein